MNIICRAFDKPEHQLLDCALSLKGIWHNGKIADASYEYYGEFCTITVLDDDVSRNVVYKDILDPAKPRQVTEAVKAMEKIYLEWEKES